jgi:hypothetical protein
MRVSVLVSSDVGGKQALRRRTFTNESIMQESICETDDMHCTVHHMMHAGML